MAIAEKSGSHPGASGGERAELPLTGFRVVEHSRGAAAAYAGRLLATMGAAVTMLEPPGGSPLRFAPPLLDDEDAGSSALFTYVAAGKRSVTCDLATAAGQRVLQQELSGADIFIDDTPLNQREDLGLDADGIAERFPSLVHVSVLPFGASGPKAHWDGEEVNLVHASGEGFLLPNGFSQQRFPDRPPLKIYGHFAEYQGGCVAALSALSALWSVAETGGEYVDVSTQDAMLLCGAFALQRLGDGSLEHRATRSFRYGGVFETRDGFLELLTLEDRQWNALVELLGNPSWARDEALRDPLERSRRGDEINAYIRAWMAERDVDDIVHRAQQLGVPAARYRTPSDILTGDHERSRNLFESVPLADGRQAQVLLAPYQFRFSPLELGGGVPPLEEAAEDQRSES